MVKTLDRAVIPDVAAELNFLRRKDVGIFDKVYDAKLLMIRLTLCFQQSVQHMSDVWWKHFLGHLKRQQDLMTLPDAEPLNVFEMMTQANIYFARQVLSRSVRKSMPPHPFHKVAFVYERILVILICSPIKQYIIQCSMPPVGRIRLSFSGVKGFCVSAIL
jgi:hypothetical protein